MTYLRTNYQVKFQNSNFVQCNTVYTIMFLTILKTQFLGKTLQNVKKSELFEGVLPVCSKKSIIHVSFISIKVISGPSVIFNFAAYQDTYIFLIFIKNKTGNWG